MLGKFMNLGNLGIPVDPETPLNAEGYIVSEEDYLYNVSRQPGTETMIPYAPGDTGYGAAATIVTTPDETGVRNNFVTEEVVKVGLPGWAKWTLGIGAGVLAIGLVQKAMGKRKTLLDEVLSTIPGSGKTKKKIRKKAKAIEKGVRKRAREARRTQAEFAGAVGDISSGVGRLRKIKKRHTKKRKKAKAKS